MSFKKIGGRRGVALIMAMWILTILVVVTTSFAFMMRTETKMAYHHRNEIRAYYIAMAGIESAIANLRSENYPNEHRTDAYAACAAVPGGVESNVSFGDGRYSLLITDEQAKININSENNPSVGTGPNQYGNVFDLLGGKSTSDVGLPDVGIRAAHIIDWADSDSVSTDTFEATDGCEDTTGGAGSGYVGSAPSRYGKDAPFDTPDEVVMVYDFDYRRYWGEDRGTDGITPSGGVAPLLPSDYPGPDPDGTEANYLLDSGEDDGDNVMENLRNYITVWSYIPRDDTHPDFPKPDKDPSNRAPINVNRVSRRTLLAVMDSIDDVGTATSDDLYDAIVASGNIANQTAFNSVVDTIGTVTTRPRIKSNSDPTVEEYDIDLAYPELSPYTWTTEFCYKSYTYKIESTGEVLVGGNVVATRKIVAVVNIDANNDVTIGPVKTLFWRDVFLEHQ